MSSRALKILHPTDLFLTRDHSVCLWLNGCLSAERPSWTILWNDAQWRYSTDGGANRLAKRSEELRHPDVVAGDMDSIEEGVQQHLLHTKFIRTPDQDKTDLTKTLELIVEQIKNSHNGKPSRIVVLGGLSGRFDHTLATLASLLKMTSLFEGGEIYVLDGPNLACVIDQGDYEIRLDRSFLTDICGFVPFAQQKTVVSSKGFKWNLENQETSFSSIISTSNLITNDVIYLSTSAPLIFTMELTHKAHHYHA